MVEAEEARTGVAMLDDDHSDEALHAKRGRVLSVSNERAVEQAGGAPYPAAILYRWLKKPGDG